MSRVIHFEIMAEDPQRAIDFYPKIFDWEIKKWGGPEDYWLVTTGPDDTLGINGAITKSRGQAMTANTIEVPSVDEFIEKVIENGGKVVAPKIAIPGVGYAAYCQDTEGVVFGLYHNDPAAK